MALDRITPSLPFSEAAAYWIASRKLDSSIRTRSARFIKPNTEISYESYIVTLNLFFGRLRLEEIHLGYIREYQEARIAGAQPFWRKRRPNRNCEIGPCPASPKKCNQEISCLRMIMDRAGCWTEEHKRYYEPFLEEVSDIPRALTPEQQNVWLSVARSQQRWWLVWWYSVLGFETSMGTNEERALRIGDVNLFHGIVSVPDAGAKNPYRARTIPLVSAESKWAAEQLLARAKDLGANSPIHFLFPWRRPPGPWDPSRPMTVSGIKRQWDEVRLASGLGWFRAYDVRHTAITRWAENGMPIADIMAMAGHMSLRMMRHYMHISEQSKRAALAAVVAKKGPQSERPEMSQPYYMPQRW